jgi:phosphonate ABC transporter permease subunit PhnE
VKTKKPLLKSIGVGLAVALGIIVFAYAFQVTDVNFETTRSEVRLTQLTRVMRALAKPDLLMRETTETDVKAPFYLPCPESGEMETGVTEGEDPYLVPSVPCAPAKEMIELEGFNFPPNSTGPINFLTTSGVKKQLGNFETDSEGYFKTEIETPNRQPVAEAQYLVATIRTTFGPLKWTDTAKATWDKIIETVFMALLATTIGTLVSIPVSFLAARNLMKDSTSTPINVALSILGWPAGLWVGFKITKWAIHVMGPLFDQFVAALLGSILLAGLTFLLVRKGLPAEDITQPTKKTKAIRTIFLVGGALSGVLSLLLFGSFAKFAGQAMIAPLGIFGFLGNALYLLGDITLMLTPAFVAIAVGAVFANILTKFGQSVEDKLNAKSLKMLNLLFTAMAGAVLFALVMAGINWFYQINDPKVVLYYPLLLGAVVGFLLALAVRPKYPLPTGLIIYTIIRTILNATRSIEPLVMAIVFVIWVSIGPFAGSLALALHTIAALSKLYSEQVESIDDGPLEAIQATGANRMQTIVYAVIPQIIPPYISFTMYRWDINVRMSTIIGFVGGGGIGFLLQQNINLLNYRAASVQMLAIAIVVATMDYISSKIRETIV